MFLYSPLLDTEPILSVAAVRYRYPSLRLPEGLSCPCGNKYIVFDSSYIAQGEGEIFVTTIKCIYCGSTLVVDENSNRFTDTLAEGLHHFYGDIEKDLEDSKLSYKQEDLVQLDVKTCLFNCPVCDTHPSFFRHAKIEEPWFIISCPRCGFSGKKHTGKYGAFLTWNILTYRKAIAAGKIHTPDFLLDLVTKPLEKDEILDEDRIIPDVEKTFTVLTTMCGTDIRHVIDREVEAAMNKLKEAVSIRDRLVDMIKRRETGTPEADPFGA